MRHSTILALVGAASVAALACATQRAQAPNPILGQAAPAFNAKATDGKTYSLANADKAPMIMVFWKNPCPHNPRASALINSVVEAYKGKVTFVGVVNSEGDAAQKFATDFAKGYPLLHDSSKSIIGSYNMKQSIQFVVINKDKKVEAIIGGYGDEAMSQLNTAMAKAAGAAEAKIDFSGAPTRTTYG